MADIKILDYLEKNLKSSPNHIMDNNDRLVWITDVWEVVDKLVSDKQKEGYTEVVKAIEAANCDNRYSLHIYMKQYIEKYPDGVYTKAFTALINGEENRLKKLK